MRLKKIFIDNLLVFWSKKGKLVHLRPRRIKTTNSEPPKLRGGLPADHITIPLAPSEIPWKKGKFDPHLTWSDREHFWFSPIEPEKISQAMDGILLDMVGYWYKHLKAINVEELTKQKFKIIRYSSKFKEQINNFLDSLPSEYHLTSNGLEKFDEFLTTEMELHHLNILDELKNDPNLKPIYAIKCVRGMRFWPYRSTEGIVLYYFPEGPFRKGTPGWYTTPLNDSYSEGLVRTMEESMQKNFGPKFFDFMKIVSRELGVTLDLPK